MCKLAALTPSHVSSNTDPKHLMIVPDNGMVTCFVHITVTLGQPAGLSKEVCLYAGADWLKLICQSEGGETPRSTGSESHSARTHNRHYVYNTLTIIVDDDELMLNVLRCQLTY